MAPGTKSERWRRLAISCISAIASNSDRIDQFQHIAHRDKFSWRIKVKGSKRIQELQPLGARQPQRGKKAQPQPHASSTGRERRSTSVLADLALADEVHARRGDAQSRKRRSLTLIALFGKIEQRLVGIDGCRQIGIRGLGRLGGGRGSCRRGSSRLARRRRIRLAYGSVGARRVGHVRRSRGRGGIRFEEIHQRHIRIDAVARIVRWDRRRRRSCRRWRRITGRAVACRGNRAGLIGRHRGRLHGITAGSRSWRLGRREPCGILRRSRCRRRCRVGLRLIAEHVEETDI